MKKYLILSFVLILFLNFTSSLNCQYRDIEKYQEFGTFLFDSSDNYFGEPLELKDFVSEYENLDGCNPVPSFKIYNQYDFLVKGVVTYKVFHPGINSFYQESESIMSVNISISPYSEQKIEGTCLNIGVNEISNESITYILSKPKRLTLKKGYRDLEKEICKICPSGKQCLDDGVSCNSDDACGSGICNIAGFCGKEKIVPCEPYGKLNCKNQSCLTPSTKEVREAYSCEWECKSDRYENGICLKSTEQLKKEADYNKKLWIIFLVFCVIFASAGYWYFKKHEGDKIKKEAEEAERRRKDAEGEFVKLKEEIDKKKEELEKLERELEKLEREKEDREIKIKKLEEKMVQATGDVKKEYQLRLEEEKKKNKEAIESINNQRRIIRINRTRLNGELYTLNKKIAEKDSLAEKSLENTQKEKDAAIAKYGGKEKVFVNDFGYVQFKTNLSDTKKAGKIYHIWLYSGKLGIGGNKEVHHIDGNKLNNEMWNLIAIDRDLHKYKVKEAIIKNEGWEFGLRYLLENGFVKKQELHRYIKEYADKRGINLD